MNFSVYLIFFVVMVTFISVEAVNITLEENPAILQMAREEFVARGTLQQTEQGFVYLKVDDNFIYRLFPFVEVDGYELLMPPYFSGDRKAGAHVTVMSSIEVSQYRVGAIAELGVQIPFTVTAFGSTAVENWPGVDRLWFLIVECPELASIRNHYGLPPKDMAFHITVAIGQRCLSE